MKNVIELLGERIVPFAKQIEERLKERYALEGFAVEVSSGHEFNRYQFSGRSADQEDYILEYDENFNRALERFTARLTLKSELKRKKLKRAEMLMKEAQAA